MSERIILLHGALGSAKQMEPLAALLEGEVICINLPGHGHLASDEEAYSIEAMAESVLPYLDEKAVIFGYSMGGYVALYLAAMYPEKIERVTTLATKFEWTPEGAQREVKMLNPEKVKEKVPAFTQLLESRHGKDWSSVMNRTAAFMLKLGEHPVLTEEVLHRVKCSVQLMRGSKDAMVSRDETLWATENIPNSCYLELMGQAHPFEKMDLPLLVNSFSG